MPTQYPALGSLASFRRPREALDAVPSSLATGPLLADGVGDVGRARRAQVTGTRSVWLMPGRKESICIASDAALNCAPGRVIEEQGLAPSIFKTGAGPFRVMGIASDEVASVEVATESGEIRAARIVDNSFLVESEAQPRQLTWLYRGQRHTFGFPPHLVAPPNP